MLRVYVGPPTSTCRGPEDRGSRRQTDGVGRWTGLFLPSVTTPDSTFGPLSVCLGDCLRSRRQDKERGVALPLPSVSSFMVNKSWMTRVRSTTRWDVGLSFQSLDGLRCVGRSPSKLPCLPIHRDFLPSFLLSYTESPSEGSSTDPRPSRTWDVSRRPHPRRHYHRHLRSSRWGHGPADGDGGCV